MDVGIFKNTNLSTNKDIRSFSYTSIHCGWDGKIKQYPNIGRHFSDTPYELLAITWRHAVIGK